MLLPFSLHYQLWEHSDFRAMSTTKNQRHNSHIFGKIHRLDSFRPKNTVSFDNTVEAYII